MGWLTRELAKGRVKAQLPSQVDIEFSEVRVAIGLKWYLGPGDEQLPPELLGAVIDDCLLDFIWLMLMNLEGGITTTEYFKWIVGKLQEAMPEDTALRAFKLTLPGNAEPKLASETYLDLARRRALYGGKPAPSADEGSRFARVFLAPAMNPAFSELDLDRPAYSILWADHLWRNSFHSELLKVSQESTDNAAAWDALMLLSRYADETGQKHLLPTEVLQWFLGASFGHPKRPGVKPAAPNRPSGLGYMLRNNEIRLTVDLLERVGMPRKAGYRAVAEAFHFAESTICRICRKPYCTVEDIGLAFKKR